MVSRQCILILIFLEIITWVACIKMQKRFEWNILDFEYQDANLKYKDMITGRLKPENALPVGIEFWNDKMFITVPRWKEGIPATLAYIPMSSPTKNPPLRPYPNLEANALGDCENGLNTAYRIHVDECDRLWVLDTGTFGIGNTTQNVCPYALNIFDLRTDTRIHRYELRKEDINANTFIANIAVEIGNTCDEAYSYFSDELGYGLIVYSLKENKSWRFQHGFFMPDPLKGDFNIDNLNFQWSEEGIFGISLSPLQKDGNRILHFSPLASNREFAVSTEILHNASKVDDSYHDFYYSEERGPDTHSTSRLMTQDGIQLFNLIDQNGVGCWNSKKPYRPENIGVIERNDGEMIFPADLKVDKNNYVWVISDRMPKFLITSLDYSEPNFRVFFAPLEVLLEGTVCETPKLINHEENLLSRPNLNQRLFGQITDYGHFKPNQYGIQQNIYYPEQIFQSNKPSNDNLQSFGFHRIFGNIQ